MVEITAGIHEPDDEKLHRKIAATMLTVQLLKIVHADVIKDGQGLNDSMECPLCKNTIRFRISPGSGHTAGRCNSGNCIEWIE